MGTKNNPGRYDCYANLEPDEPYFVLMGRDPLAASLVRSWATVRQQQVEQGMRPVEDIRKVSEARECAAAMEQYQRARIAAQLAEINQDRPHDPEEAARAGTPPAVLRQPEPAQQDAPPIPVLRIPDTPGVVQPVTEHAVAPPAEVHTTSDEAVEQHEEATKPADPAP